jgi:hypothetical protein
MACRGGVLRSILRYLRMSGKETRRMSVKGSVSGCAALIQRADVRPSLDSFAKVRVFTQQTWSSLRMTEGM